MTITELNSLDCDRFVESVGWVFEHSPWVAVRAWQRRPFHSISALHATMIHEVQRATRDEQLNLIRAHPDLGTRARISSASTEEQAGAGLSALSPEEFDRLQDLNAAYRARFGFPFLFAVKGSTKYDVLRALEDRLLSPPDVEFGVALDQIYRIADFRLRDLLTDTKG